MEIIGSTIKLRRMDEGDLENKVRWFNDPQVNKTLILNETLELDKTLKWFQKIKEDKSRIDFVIETDTGRPVGLIGLVEIDRKHKTAEIFIVIGEKDYWGKGIMLRAESMLIRWAFENLDLYRIWAPSLAARTWPSGFCAPAKTLLAMIPPPASLGMV